MKKTEFLDRNITLLKDRLMLGIDFECPSLALTWHRCHKYIFIQLIVFYINFHYDKK